MIDPKDASYIEGLETEVAKLRAEIDNKDVEIKRLKKEKGLSSARDGLTFNQRNGIWYEQSGQGYCPKCLDQEKRNPLMTDKYSFRCTVCGHAYNNPDAPPPQVIRTRGGGPQGWMR